MASRSLLTAGVFLAVAAIAVLEWRIVLRIVLVLLLALLILGMFAVARQMLTMTDPPTYRVAHLQVG
jgi:hypothetical protein